jgi:hypothetical protein
MSGTASPTATAPGQRQQRGHRGAEAEELASRDAACLQLSQKPTLRFGHETLTVIGVEIPALPRRAGDRAGQSNCQFRRANNCPSTANGSAEQIPSPAKDGRGPMPISGTSGRAQGGGNPARGARLMEGSRTARGRLRVCRSGQAGVRGAPAGWRYPARSEDGIVNCRDADDALADVRSRGWSRPRPPRDRDRRPPGESDRREACGAGGRPRRGCVAASGGRIHA